MTKALPPKSLVLYADDDADDHELVREAFEAYAHAVELVPFYNGQELLRYLEGLPPLQPKPCLIILDINMPQLDGKQTLRRLRGMTEFEDLPTVLFTTSTMPSEADFAHRYNAGFVTKPLHAKQINAIVDRLIDHCTDDVRNKLRRGK